MRKKTAIIQESAKLSRVTEIRLQGKTLSTPTYFPAISSYGVKIPLSYLVYLLANYSYPRILVSAYDIFHADKREKKALFSGIRKYDRINRQRNKGFLFLDSGIYESSWYGDPNWNIDSYKALVSKVKFDFYSSFDVLPEGKNKKHDKKFIEQTFANIAASRAFSNKGQLVAILHGRTPDHLVSIVREFVGAHPNLCDVVAIPERDCGKSILERAATIVEVRGILNDNDYRNLLHVLGCGDPMSILIYSFCGVDFFDSLDWYEHVISRDARERTLSVMDFSQLDLLNCECKACTLCVNGNYEDRALLHNLHFYQKFMEEIQSLIRNNGISSFMSKHIGKSIVEKINHF